MDVTEMDTSNRASNEGLGMKRKGSETLGSSPPQKPNFENIKFKSPPRKVRVKTMSMMLCSKNYPKFKYLGQII